MSGSEDNGEAADGPGEEVVADAGADPAAELRETRLRRGLFGFRGGDVRAELAARNAEAEELRDDVAALWLVFNQHERAIRELIGAVERLGGGRIPKPGERNWDDPEDEGDRGTIIPDAWMADQMEGLDEVLAAIKQATDLLERGYEAVEQAPAPPGAAPLPPLPRPPRSGSGNAAERD